MIHQDGIRIGRTRTIPVENIHSNITPEILEITIDKLRIVLLQHESSLSDTNSWQTPLAILITIVLVLCTTSFKEFLLLSAAIWNAIFIISAALSLAWLLKCLANKKKRMTIDELINCMKKNA